MAELELGRYPVAVEIPVAWGEMDAYGHVNNTVYLRWCETARVEYFDRLGLHERMQRERVGPILARACVDYRRPVVFPDTIRVGATVTRLGSSSFTMAYRLESLRQGALVAGGESVVVLFDYGRGEKVALDERLRARIGEVERGGAAAV